MRIYLTDINKYLELSEKPSFEYNSILFQYDDLMMSRSCDLTIPRTTNNDAVLGHPLISGNQSTVIDSVHEACFAGEAVSVKGTLYVSECTADGYECTFTYGDLLGADELNTDLSECLSLGTTIGVKLAAGSYSSSVSVPTTLNPMVCMNYKVELESSSNEYGTGFTSADMHCVIYATKLGYWIALGDKDGWYSYDTSRLGIRWSQIENAVISAYTWYSISEDSNGYLVAAGMTDYGEMVVARSADGLSWMLIRTSSSSYATMDGTGCVTAASGNAVLCVSQVNREVVLVVDGALAGTGVLPSAIARVYGAFYSSDYSFVIYVHPYQDSTGGTVIAYTTGSSSMNLKAIGFDEDYYVPGTYGDELLHMRVITDYVYYFSTKNGNVLTCDDNDMIFEMWEKWGSTIAARDMCGNGSYFVAVGADGTTWQKAYSPIEFSDGGSAGDNTLNCVYYYNGIWVTVGDNGSMYYSTDHGVSWSACEAIVSVIETDFAPMPCVNLAWLAYRAALACGYTLSLSESGDAVAPYLYIMLPSCLDSYGLEVAEGDTCYLQYNLPDTTALELVTLYAALMGEAMYVDGDTIKFFTYDFGGVDKEAYDLSGFGSLIHAVTTDGAQSNVVRLDVPDENETGDGVAQSYSIQNETLEEELELLSTDISAGASYSGILQVSNVEIDTDDDEITVSREGDATLCWLDTTNEQMMYACDGRMSTMLKKYGLTLDGVTNLGYIYSSPVTVTVTLIIPLFRFMALTHSSLIVIEGIPYCVKSATWSDGACECELVKIPQSLI